MRKCRLHSCQGPLGADALEERADLWLLGWTCGEECRYTCMHAVETARAEAGARPVQYFGKWPFTRHGGCQELLSTLFSAGNALPHLHFLAVTWRKLPSSSMATALAVYALLCINTWWWSTAFHCRDNFWTERLDYHCASVLLVASLFVSLVRVLRIRSLPVMGALGAVLGGAFAAHVWHMNTVLFDYGWNMQLSMGAVAATTLLWAAWCSVHWRTRPYVRHMAAFNVLLICAAAFELFDFPPLAGLLDAHSVWHGLTIPLGVYFYHFWAADAAAEAAHNGAASLYAPRGAKARVEPAAAAPRAPPAP